MPCWGFPEPGARDRVTCAAVSSEFLPFSRPSIDEDELAAVIEVIRSGLITTGEKCRLMEEKFCEVLGCGDAVTLTSATAGMHLAMHARGIGPGDEVITPSMTWVSTLNLIVLSGATPVFADVDRGSRTPSSTSSEPESSIRSR